MTSSDDDETARLHQEIASLKRQNAFLRGMLTDAIDLAGLAIKLDAVADQVGEAAAEDDEPWDGVGEQGGADAASFRTLFKTG